MRRRTGAATGFTSIYRKIRKEVPAPTKVEEPRKGKGHTYSKRDRGGWKKQDP